MHLMYLMTVAAAAKTIDLQASYFVPDRLMIEALILASKRGVQTRIVVPGRHIDPTSYDQPREPCGVIC